MSTPHQPTSSKERTLETEARIPSPEPRTATAEPRSRGRSAVAAAIIGGMIAGTLDIGAACLINRRGVGFILHAIAGGLLAERSFQGGAASAVLGAFLQELMGVMIAAIFVFAARRRPVLRRRWLAFGLAYGVIIFFVMNYVVVPLSAWHRFPAFDAFRLAGNLCAMLLFGLIVAYFARDISMGADAREGGPTDRRSA
jgi:hypothetical protein